jgi:hypothetical protein
LPSVLTIRAGARALERIRREGLDPRSVEVIPGAAGGPKGLGIAGLDRAIFGEWLPSAPRVRHLIGASIGAWRFAAACCREPAKVLAEFADTYVRQTYPKGADARYISEAARDMLRTLFAGREAEILGSEGYRLHVLTVRGRWPLVRDSALHTPLGFGFAALANMVGRRHLAWFIERTMFVDARDRPPIAPIATLQLPHAPPVRFDAFHTHHVVLDRTNLHDALLASASIPMVLQGVRDIANAPRGIYWDGGIIDYHLHLPYHHAEGLVLYPHFTDRIVPGWLDKALPWRQAAGPWLDNVVLVSPSREYLATLPFGKLPDRRDFARFRSDDAGRMRYWRQAIAESERLADAFLSWVRSPQAADIQPL